jgi:putative membrane protein
MRHTFQFALSAALVASALTLAAQNDRTPPNTPSQPAPATATPVKPAAGGDKAADTMSAADHAFVMDAARGGMAEVELGKMASEKASNDKVKAFGQQMVTDHGKANDELKSIAMSKNMTLPADVGPKHKATSDRLSKLSGAAFDRAYMDEMVKDHTTVAAAFHKDATTGKDAEIKAWAGKTVPTVEDHLKMAKDTQKQLGSAKTPTP